MAKKKKKIDEKHLKDIADGYYSFKRLINKHPEALYYLIYGERSNGKSYSILEFLIEEFVNSEYTKSFGYIRRWKEDIYNVLLNQVFKSIKKDDLGRNRISDITKGEYNDILVKDKCFYLMKRDEDGEIETVYEKQPFGYIFSLSSSERIKSTGYPDIFYIFFEEFISEGLPMVNEFARFRSVLSTIIRNDDKVKIIMAGNTINKHNIYFKEFGLKRTKQQQANTIDIYKYVDDETLDENGKPRILYIACEFADFPNRKLKKSNIYFAFDKEKNKMIRNGAWDIGSYPHLEYFYTPADIKLIYFIKFEDEIFQAEIIMIKDCKDTRIFNDEANITYSNRKVCFTYIHKKTSDIKYPDKHIIFQQEFSSKPNIRQDINNAYDDIGKFIKSFYTTNKVVYQDNEVGDNINAFLSGAY